MRAATASRRFFVPEVVQSSAMDCGPAALKALLEGHRVHVGYGRLREACQTDVDGTSIDSLEEVAVQLGLDAEQVMLPVDHLLVPEARALPALLVVQLATGATHFVVAWRRVGPFVEVMDPATGRRFLTRRRFLAQTYVHRHAVPAAAWRKWTESEELRAPLAARLGTIGLSPSEIAARIDAALEDPTWRSIAALDATARMVRSLLDAGALRPRETARLLPELLDRVRGAAPDTDIETDTEIVPDPYWSVRPPSEGEGDETTLELRGAVLVRVLGLRQRSRLAAADAGAGETSAEESGEPPLSPELAAALEEEPVSAWRTLADFVRRDGLRTPAAVAVAGVAAAATVIVEALLLRGLLDLGPLLGSGPSRLGAALALVAFAALLFGLDRRLAEGSLRVGRHLELRLRAAFFTKIPRLPHRYFKSRLVSDMVERGHAVHRVRQLPGVARRLLQNGAQLAFTTLGIVWLDPGAALVATVVAVVSLGLPLLVHPVLAERDLKVRGHQGALSRFYLDALLGLVAVRTHAAERSVRREHETLLLEWRRASYELLRASVATQGLQILVGFGLGAWLLVDHLGRAGLGGGVLLLVYWALQLPQLGQQIAADARTVPSLRSVLLRLMEPLTAPEDDLPREDLDADPESPASAGRPAEGRAAEIVLDGVAVRAGGHWILREVDVSIASGEHVAVVGASGAGKSTLVGLLLGWHRPAEGRLLLDGRPLDAAALDRLRLETAWVDPAVQLWNRSLHANLVYGSGSTSQGPESPLDRVLEDADLGDVLERLPDGLRTPLGEGGALVSGGEGQRVRLGRAYHRRAPRLAVLDEPFRGLDRPTRRRLLGRARERWADATLVCVTHDVTDTTDFPRVLVVEDGRVVEDGVPAELLASSSRYAALVRAEAATRELWRAGEWRRLWISGGRVSEERISTTDSSDHEEASP